MRDQYKNSAKWYDRIIEPLISGLRATGLKMYPVNEDMAILDIGCGTGSFLTCYKKYTSKIFGIDLSPSMIKVARKKLGEKANIILGSATKTEFKAHYFDLITCSLILHELSHLIVAKIVGGYVRENFMKITKKYNVKIFLFMSKGLNRIKSCCFNCGEHPKKQTYRTSKGKGKHYRPARDVSLFQNWIDSRYHHRQQFPKAKSHNPANKTQYDRLN
jgi:SAM-dependent methyltransferase